MAKANQSLGLYGKTLDVENKSIIPVTVGALLLAASGLGIPIVAEESPRVRYATGYRNNFDRIEIKRQIKQHIKPLNIRPQYHTPYLEM